MSRVESMPVEQLASPGLLFERRADIQHRKAKILMQAADLKAEMFALDDESDRLDAVISIHLDRDPRRAVQAKVFADYSTVVYSISKVDGIVACLPMISGSHLDPLTEADVEVALSRHAENVAAARAYGEQIKKTFKKSFTPSASQIREAVIHEATARIYGADAATAIFPDDESDDTGEFEPVVEESPWDQDKAKLFPATVRLQGRQAVISDGVPVSGNTAG